MKFLVELSCRAYAAIVSLHAESLQYRYSDEMKLVFRESITEASMHGLLAMARVWATVAGELVTLLGPAYAAKAGILAASVTCSSALVATAAMSFCTLGPVIVVHGYSATTVDTAAILGRKDRSVTLPDGQRMFLSCWEPREIHGINTVILASGRGIGDHTGWVPLQTAVSQFARVCTYDPVGVALSGPGTPPTTVDELIEQMHGLFESASLPKPYILVGTSAGGVLVRRYESRFPGDVAAFVFADSSHEEMEWRNAAIAESFDPGWNDAKNLRNNGYLPKGELLHWHDDVPMVVLERGERAPCNAFPNLTHQQCDGINDAWHSYQVDLSHRSKYAQLRVVQGAGHRMVMQKPEAVAQAVHDVIDQMDQIDRMQRKQ
jgi:pimeloyl-ACP methyl ester carboxylesterase